MKKYDVIIIGAGAAGLSAARGALSNGRKILILDMGGRPARKVLASGGGRCNFTNTAVSRDRYFGQNPDFARSAIAAVKPADILDWMTARNLRWAEKEPGRFFCATGSRDIADALIRDAGGADIVTNTKVSDIEKTGDEFAVFAANAAYYGKSVIIATGGISYPALGVSDFGYVIAKKFGHKIVPPMPGLVAMKTDLFDPGLAGISLNVEIKSDKKTVSDSLLFTHFGIGGPAAYRASLFDLSKDFHIDFLPRTNARDWLTRAKQTDGKKSLAAILSGKLPMKFAKWISGNSKTNIADCKDSEIARISQMINRFSIPGGALRRRDLRSAEIVAGGVSTENISSKTMESKLCPGLFFAGEVLDIAGDLGGFNLHFAFASGTVAGRYANIINSER
ncbi:MAG: NAD(P)/FAD-dependent oxidoreductase [Rickettsiales bacterium]|jgi:predicted Rossmann fold flavoprotein|nr:NAD(P)/FAD-dependent oxidoreductase [Rickettsiales bacterium]